MWSVIRSNNTRISTINLRHNPSILCRKYNQRGETIIMETVKLKFEAKYTTHTVKANKAVDITFKMPYTELTQYIGSIQMLNENVTVAAKIGSDKKPNKLGTFMITNISVDRDGQGTLKVNSQLDYVESKSINELASRNDEPMFLFLKADIDTEGNDEADEQ